MTRRQNGLGALSTESHHVDPREHIILSNEEMGVLIDDAAQDAAQVDTDLDQADKIIEIAQNLEDMTNKAEAKGELSDGEAAMMESAGDMAVAGTELSGEAIIPNMENYRADGKIQFSLALEDFRSTIRSAWASVKRLIAKVWKYIKDFFYKLVGTIPTLKRRIQGLKDRARSTAGKTRENAKFEIANTQALHVGKAPVKSYEALHSALKVNTKVAENFYGDESLKKAGTAISDSLADFNVDNPGASVDKLAEKLKSALGGGGSVLHRSLSDKRWKGYTTKASDDMLGGKLVVLSVPDASEVEGDGSLGLLNTIRRTLITVEQSHDGDTDTSGNVDFATLSPAEVGNVLDEALRALEKLEDFERGKLKKDLAERQTKIEQAGEKAEKSVEKIRSGSDNAEEREAVPYYRALIEMAAWYARCVASPSTGIARNIIRSAQITITLAEKSLNQYK